MKTTVKKWGNSLGIRITKAIAQDNHLEEGSEINITTKDGVIILEPIHEKFTLNSLLENITEENIHNEISTGNPIGGEAW